MKDTPSVLNQVDETYQQLIEVRLLLEEICCSSFATTTVSLKALILLINLKVAMFCFVFKTTFAKVAFYIAFFKNQCIRIVKSSLRFVFFLFGKCKMGMCLEDPSGFPLNSRALSFGLIFK